MPRGQSYKARALVLRKTKLGERDLIVTLMRENGELMKAVAKGARKPGGSFAAKLELFCLVDVMAARGKSLDVITDARLAPESVSARFGIEQAACASAVAELLSSVCQEGLEQPRLFDMARVALSALASSAPDDALAITAAALVKIVSAAGFRPTLEACQSCGGEITPAGKRQTVLFSFMDGGVTCSACARSSEGVLVEASVIEWMRALLYARFVDIPQIGIDSSTSHAVLGLIGSWIEFYIGRPIRSLSYLEMCQVSEP